MKVLVIGAGGVGESICAIIKRRGVKAEWAEKVVLADYNFEKAEQVVAKYYEPERFIAEQVDALNKDELIKLAKKYDIGLIFHCLIAEGFTPVIMDAAIACNCHYIDMGLMETERDPDDPNIIIKELGAKQYERSDEFEKRNLFASIGCGIEPGMSDYFARFAELHFFDQIEGLFVRDGSNLTHPTKDLVFGFSIFTTAMECIYGPHLYSEEKGIYSVESLSLPEEFWLPGGIGLTRMVAVEHSEPLNYARHIKGLKESDFKIGYGKEFEDAMKNLRQLGLLTQEPVKVKGCEVSPIDLLGAVSEDPKDTGKELIGKTCGGVWVKGKKDGLERQVYIYQVSDNQECLEKYGTPVVVAQTAVTPVIVAELIAKGKMEGPYGVRISEEYNPMPVLAMLEDYEFPAGVLEMESEYRNAIECKLFKEPFEK